MKIKTDHHPLEAIVWKPLNNAPSRLQRMLLRLQKYNLKVKYKKGKEMFLADTSSNPVMSTLRDTIQRGWPPSKSGIPENMYPYFDIWDELVIQDNLIFKGPQLVIPATMRKEMMSVTHASHIGIEGCIRRARETMYWPRMSCELKEYISKCMAHRTAPGREPIMQPEFAARPWAKVGADLCDHAGWTLLVVSDYYSNFIEVKHLHSR